MKRTSRHFIFLIFSGIFTLSIGYQIYVLAFSPWIPKPISSDAIIHNQLSIHALRYKLQQSEAILELPESILTEESNGNDQVKEFPFENPTNITMVTTYFDIGRVGRGPEFYLKFLEVIKCGTPQ